jgi:xanthine dehydrogenase accessory factor
MLIRSSEWPLFGWAADVRPALGEARQAGRDVVLGTLVRVEGSAPRPIGTLMLFDEDVATGYFSGGCLEADVANHAAAVRKEGEPRVLVYGRGSPWIDIRLLCGGRLEVLLERVTATDPAGGDLLDMGSRREPALWMTDGRVRQVARAVSSAPLLEWNGTDSRLRFDPAWRVIVVGGDPIALAMAQLASTSGFETIMVRPDGPSMGPPLPNVAYRRQEAFEAIADLAPDEWTCIVTATHDDEVDDRALLAALHSDAAYVGVLGSVARAAERRGRLLAAGLPASRLSALHAPIGLARCGKAPWEVAVSVVAEIMQVRTAARGQALRRGM